MSIYTLLADFIVLAHLAYVAFVVLGLPIIWVGLLLRRPFARSLWFRGAHLAMILVVVAESLVGVTCPLTTWEQELREQAGEAVQEGSFVGRLAHDLLFIEATPAAFTVAYSLFGALVLGTFLFFPPRRRKAPRNHVAV